MAIQDFQKFLETHVSGACVPVDLLKIAKSVGYRRNHRGKGVYGYGCNTLTLVVDGECCLDRLYGGFFSDWVCGGQWNRMVQFLAVLIQTIQNNNIELAVFFNGALEQERLGEWAQLQYSTRRNINSVLKHVTVKGTPPPKVWWVAPVGLRTCLRMALRHLNIPVICTMDDHHQEVIAFCRENNYHGLMAEDAEYIIFDPPRYFSSHQLKLTYKGSLETKEFILDEVAKGLGLPRNYFCLLAALLGNYLLPEDQLHDFYASIIPSYNKDLTSQEEIIRAVVKFLATRSDVNNLVAIGAQAFGSMSDPRVARFKESVQYFLNGTKDGFLRYKPFSSGYRDGPGRHPYQTYYRPEPRGMQNGVAERTGSSEDSGPQIDLTPPLLPSVPHEVMRTASERHQKGLMCSWVYQVLTQGEVKFSPCMEDEVSRDLPPIIMFYRPIRQNVYAILFNLHHHTFMAKKAKEEGHSGLTARIPEVKIREWVWSKNNPYRTPDIVDAIPVNWAVPTVQRLWFGSVVDDKKRRLRAFLSCMNSDSPLMLHTSYIPQHMLIMAAVLRYIVSSLDDPILRKQELDAFLVTAFSPDLTNANYLQDLQVPLVTARGVQLASLFMAGVEMALFANEACGSPVPWIMCCPWLFFDGKLFHSKLVRANCARSLIEVCEGRIDLVAKVERCRQAILEGLHIDFAQFHGPSLSGVGTKMGPSYTVACPGIVPTQQVPPSNRGGRGRGSSGGGLNRLYSRGGQLQVAGVVVGSWSPNYGSTTAYHGERFAVRGGYSGRGRGGVKGKGRPAVLAKRRVVKKQPPKAARGRSQTTDNSGQEPVSKEGVNESGPAAHNHKSEDHDPEGLAPYQPHTPHTPHSQSSNGLKSPDSGVNVSILE